MFDLFIRFGRSKYIDIPFIMFGLGLVLLLSGANPMSIINDITISYSFTTSQLIVSSLHVLSMLFMGGILYKYNLLKGNLIGTIGVIFLAPITLPLIAIGGYLYKRNGKISTIQLDLLIIAIGILTFSLLVIL